jgi:hypothetical protein
MISSAQWARVGLPRDHHRGMQIESCGFGREELPTSADKATARVIALIKIRIPAAFP